MIIIKSVLYFDLLILSLSFLIRKQVARRERAMRLHSKMFLPSFLILLLAPALSLTQGICAEIVQTALAATDENCNDIGRNQACYGNVMLEAVPQANVADFTFTSPGDIVDVAGVETLSLSSRVEEEGVWGIALMKIQANIPESLPGENVTFLLFGQVDITNRVETNVEPVTFEVVAKGNLNVRSGPSITDEIIASLADGDTVTAIGRDAYGAWLQVELADSTSGWVFLVQVEPNGVVSDLDVIDLLTGLPLPPPPPLNPMQAFYFRSGINDAPCVEAPDSGILIQTPEGAGHIELTVNEVNITLGSTVYLQAQASGDMIISVVEGQATVAAFRVPAQAPAGTRVRIPLDANGVAAGPPVGPEPYDGARMSVLPVQSMPLNVPVATPLNVPVATLLPADEIRAWSSVPINGNYEGTYEFERLSVQTDQGTCTYRYGRFPDAPRYFSGPIFVRPDGSVRFRDGILTPVGNGDYSGEYQISGETRGTYTIRVVGPGVIEGEHVLIWDTDDAACGGAVLPPNPFHIEWVLRTE
jgi:hypothetical protein